MLFCYAVRLELTPTEDAADDVVGCGRAERGVAAATVAPVVIVVVP